MLGRPSRSLALAQCLALARAVELRPAAASSGAAHSRGGDGPARGGRKPAAASPEPEDPPFVGWVAVAVAMLSFGTFGVPIKSQAVREAQVHPLVFQSYKTFWVLATAWIVLSWEEFRFSPWGLLSGVFWVPSGIAAVVAVNNVGLAVGQATWQVTIVIVSFLWGCVGFHEHIKSPVQAVVGMALLLGGLLGMTCVVGHSARQAKQESSEVDALLTETQLSPSKGSPGSSGLTRARRLGIAAALFNGVWGGSNLVPMKFAHLGGPRYAISFAVGAAVVNAAIWVLYAGYLFIQSPGESVIVRLPPLHFGVMKISGTISGVLWSVGNFASMWAVAELGLAIGYSCVQASILISGLWGILLYGEIKGKGILFWLVSAVLALAGVIVLAEQKG